MGNPALDQIGLVKAQRAGHPQAQLERRETAPVGFEERRIHADRRSGLQACIGEAMDDRGKSEMAGRVEILRLDPAARGRDEAGPAFRFGPFFDRRAFPCRQAPIESATLFG